MTPLTQEQRDRLTREAVAFAVWHLQRIEKETGYSGDSAQLASWRQLRDELEQEGAGK